MSATALSRHTDDDFVLNPAFEGELNAIPDAPMLRYLHDPRAFIGEGGVTAAYADVVFINTTHHGRFYLFHREAEATPWWWHIGTKSVGDDSPEEVAVTQLGDLGIVATPDDLTLAATAVYGQSLSKVSVALTFVMNVDESRRNTIDDALAEQAGYVVCGERSLGDHRDAYVRSFTRGGLKNGHTHPMLFDLWDILYNRG